MQAIRSIGLILDGNRRFAKAHGLSPVEGHKAGYESLKKLAAEVPRLKKEYGVEYLTVYLFSTENWNRAKEEIGPLMALFEEGLRFIVEDAVRKGAADKKEAMRIKVIGERHRFSPALQDLMRQAEEKTADFGGVTVVCALSYGGRAEIAAAAESLRLKGSAITEESLSQSLWTAGVPDPDIIIRTGGEKRLSNFLPWQSVYSELFFVETLWPDFTVEHLKKIFAEFYERERRYGA